VRSSWTSSLTSPATAGPTSSHSGRPGPRRTAVSTGSGNFLDLAPAINDFGAALAQDRQHPHEVVDLNDDRRADIVGFGIQGTWIALSNGNGTFGPIQLLIGDFGSNQGWNADQHVRAAADITGDGLADLVGFGNDGVWSAVTTP
jgi:hypothetical protein